MTRRFYLFISVLILLFLESCTPREEGGSTSCPFYISLSEKSVNIETNSSHILHFESDLPPSESTLIWTSEDTGLVEVNAGIITSKNATGTTMVTVASAIYPSVRTACSVTVYNEQTAIHVKDVVISPEELVLYVGESVQLKVNIVPEDASDKTVVWSSTASQVATVDEKGCVLAVSAGEASITAKANDGGIQATCAIRVKRNEVTSVSISKEKLTLKPGQSAQLKASITAKDPDVQPTDTTLTWNSSNPSVATVKDGLVQALAEGSSIITVASFSNQSAVAQCELTVYDDGKTVLADKIIITPDHLNLYLHQTKRLEAEVLPENTDNKNIRWGVPQGAVVTVNNRGEVTGVIVGRCRVIAESEDGNAESYIFVTVLENRVASLSFEEDSYILSVGQEYELNVSVIGEDASGPASNQNVIWQSSEPTVVSVMDGHVRALAEGTAIITASSAEDTSVKATCIVTVIVPNPHGDNLSSNGTANCYIVPAAGTYRFDITKGNDRTLLTGVTSARVLWETRNDNSPVSPGTIIKYDSVRIDESAIVFSTPSSLQEGNAIIAAYDSGGDVVWSWHIWVCEGYDPVYTRQTYTGKKASMMDRNLGALSPEAGDVRANGLFYQWGRKDPFPGAGEIYVSEPKGGCFITTTHRMEIDRSESATVLYSVRHPATFIATSRHNGNWIEIPDNTLWSSSKTIYDPCPPGWRVPDAYVIDSDKQHVRSSEAWTDLDYSRVAANELYGVFLDNKKAWYPNNGYISLSGELLMIGQYSCYWSCSPNSQASFAMEQSRTPSGLTFNPSCYGKVRGEGHSVRCVEDN